MKKIKIFFLIFLFLISIRPALAQENSDIKVIANNDVKLTEVDGKFIQKLFLGKTKKWPDSSKAVPLILKDDNAEKIFVEKYVGKSLSKFKNHWKKLIFTGRGIPPKEFKTVEELTENMKKISGSISFVPKSADTSGLKILDIK